jgi:hypothetical protein
MEVERVMSEKSHVSMEQHVCLVCGQAFDTGAILLDRRLRPSMPRHTVTGWDLCPEHRRLHEAGFVALVECDPTKSGDPGSGEKVSPNQVWRTGRLAHLKREIFVTMFNVAADPNTPCAFVDPEVMAMLEKLQPPAE